MKKKKHQRLYNWQKAGELLSIVLIILELLKFLIMG